MHFWNPALRLFKAHFHSLFLKGEFITMELTMKKKCNPALFSALDLQNIGPLTDQNQAYCPVIDVFCKNTESCPRLAERRELEKADAEKCAYCYGLHNNPTKGGDL